ncbi:23S rRNA (guanosine(2251)-2'-O)-methyltransferase RlmB [Saccharobesus litoralis]|uniref:23S rRNA (guanosine-2'-O-)-methyltransferase RlmB n=1 Tax=Saccharobesus litoralis TaxID=2172099 RepID=A0A2S0VRZ6_9ALTE|nr:23S rRNA (guanosine(2251)-2'-O)-methyltransferase RlmB [Saccharobesus litoralis]AWB66979.1 23S rRNA (guanosine(2251)-2'-O)-methyltransferase RlmB [Saccharobesus litoralis]
MSKSETIYGLHAVEAALQNEPERFIELHVLKGREDNRLNSILHLAKRIGLPVQTANRRALDEKTHNARHQGVVARVKAAPTLNESDLDVILDKKGQSIFLLVLDGVTDPHNIGACLRTADAAGVDALIVPKDKSASLTSTARKVACGAAEAVPFIQVTNLSRTLKHIQDKGIWIVGTAGEATSTLHQAKLTGPMALVMGAEGKGMRRLTRENCDELISIPMAGEVSSLNVSVATGVCLFEIVRQRNL